MPNFFWDSEPTLHPLYAAIREYLEIDPRIKVLNERCRVFLDLAEILSDSVNDSKMSSITWIIIILILVSILVTVTEVGLRFVMLERSKQSGDAQQPSPPALAQISWAEGSASPDAVPPLLIGQAAEVQTQTPPAPGEVPSALEELARTLGLEGNATLEQVKSSIRTLQDEAASVPAVEGIHVDELR